MDIFRFIRGSMGLGVGTADLGLLRSHAVPASSNSTSRDIPRRSLAAAEGAMTYAGSKSIRVSLQGNGSGIYNGPKTQPLAIRSK